VAWFYRMLLELVNAETTFSSTMKIAGAMAASAHDTEMNRCSQVPERGNGQ
jgi:hypothetical protein